MNFFKPSRTASHESGNMLFMILIAVVLIGLLTAAVMNSSGSENSTIDGETLAVRVSEVQRQAGELERAVLFIIHNGKSESDIRFAHALADPDYGDLSADTDPTDEVFHKDGGGANYPKTPDSVNDGSKWEFYGGTHLPGVGSDKADLVAVLPNVTKAFCDRVNKLDGQSGTPADTGAGLASGASAGSCVNLGAGGRFNDATQFYAIPNTVDETTFTQNPEISAAQTALEACVHCDADNKNHFYHVLLAR